jgi:hypothetical protein
MKQHATEKHPPLSTVGCIHPGDEAPRVNTNRSKTKVQTKEKFQVVEIDLSNMILTDVAPVATHP